MDQFSTSLSSIVHKPFVSVSLFFHQSFTSLSLIFHQSFISVFFWWFPLASLSSVFHQDFISLSSVFHQCFFRWEFPPIPLSSVLSVFCQSRQHPVFISVFSVFCQCFVSSANTRFSTKQSFATLAVWPNCPAQCLWCRSARFCAPGHWNSRFLSSVHRVCCREPGFATSGSAKAAHDSCL